MGSVNNKGSRQFGAHQNPPLCARSHQIGALFLVCATFFLTRAFDRLLATSAANGFRQPHHAVQSDGDGSVSWPGIGYGSHLSLKIYVYDEDEIQGLKPLMFGRDGKITAAACLKGQWGTQVKIHRLLQQSKFRTRKKEEADFFFVPAYVKCVRMLGGLNDKEINQAYLQVQSSYVKSAKTVVQLVEDLDFEGVLPSKTQVLSQMPYFRLSGGRDHIFVFPSGAGAHLFKSWATYINRSIILTPEADRTDKKDTSAFNTWKDIIIPGNVDDGMTSHGAKIVQPLPLSKRKYLANYLGRDQGKVGRLKLIELAKQFPEKLESPVLKFSGPDKLKRLDYFEHLRDAKFCLAPRGESSWTLRFYESFFVECVPVILSDQVELPFQNVIDYSQISIKWPSSEIGPQLLEYLESIPDAAVEEMIARGRRVRCLYVYASDSATCSTMQGILWELQRKVRQFHQSTETFWLHNGSFVNRQFVEFSNWKSPMPLP